MMAETGPSWRLATMRLSPQIHTSSGRTQRHLWPCISEPAARIRSSTGRWVVNDEVMIRSSIFCVSLAFAAMLLAGEVQPAHGQEGPSVQQSIAAAQADLRHRRYSQAIQTLQEALKRFPGNSKLRVELGRTYVYERRDGRALEIFREVLAADPNDEAAATGLVRNLLLQKKKDEASSELELALARHPNSIRLQEYKDDLQKNQLPLPVTHEISALNRVQADASYFSDSAGNRVLSAGERLDVEIGRQVTNSFRIDEKSLWESQGPKANIFTVNDEGRVRLARWLFVAGGAGIGRC